jgi:hypothetical protein
VLRAKKLKTDGAPGWARSTDPTTAEAATEQNARRETMLSDWTSRPAEAFNSQFFMAARLPDGPTAEAHV